MGRVPDQEPEMDFADAEAERLRNAERSHRYRVERDEFMRELVAGISEADAFIPERRGLQRIVRSPYGVLKITGLE